MKKIYIIAMFMCAATASAQVSSESTSYGERLKKNFNLRFDAPEKVHTEVTAGFHVSGGDYTASGMDITVRRQYKIASVGVMASSEYSSEFGFANSTALVGGVKFGKAVTLGLDALAGFGQAHTKTYSTDAYGDTNLRKESTWKPFVGAQARLGFAVSKSVELLVYGGYKHSFVQKPDELTYATWETEKQTTDANRWFAGTGVNVSLGSKAQWSGDNCWYGEAFGGWSNNGAIAGAKALHFKRTAAKIGRVLGFGTQYTFNDETTNEIFGQAGLRFLPQGAQSPVVFDAGIMIGVGEFDQKAEGSTTENARLTKESNLYAFGADAKAYAGVTYHTGRVSLGVEGYFGGYKSTSNDFGGDFGYVGGSNKTSGVLYGGALKIGVSL